MADNDAKLDVHFVGKSLILSYTFTSNSDLAQKPTFAVIQQLGWAKPESGKVDPAGSTQLRVLEAEQIKVLKEKRSYLFKYELAQLVTSVKVRVWATPPQSPDETPLREDEDKIAIGSDLLSKKKVVVLKVLPDGKTEPSILQFGAIFTDKDGTNHVLTSVEGSYQDAKLKQQILDSHKNLWSRSNPLVIQWRVDSLSDDTVVEFESAYDSASVTAEPGTKPVTEKKSDVTQATKDGGEASGVTWKQKVGLMECCFDLRLKDQSGKILKQQTICAYGDDPMPTLDSFSVTTENGNPMIPPSGGKLVLQASTSNGRYVSLRVKAFDHSNGDAEIETFVLKSHSDDQQNKPLTWTVDPSKYKKGNLIYFRVAMFNLPKSGNNASNKDPWKFDDDGAFLAAAGPVQMKVSDEFDKALVPPFTFTPIVVRNLWEAVKWVPHTTGMTGTQANQVVNLTYHQLHLQLQDYIGAPHLSNWFTYGKWASREAGQGINDLSAAMTAMLELLPSGLHSGLWSLAPLAPAVLVGKYIYDHTAQFEVLYQISTGDWDWHNMRKPSMAFQVLKMALTTIGVVLTEPSDFRDPVFLAKLVAGFISPILKGAMTATEIITKLYDNLGVMVRCLIIGNQGIYRNMVPGALAFLQGEADGGKGIEKFQAWAKTQPDDSNDLWMNGTCDPQNFLLNAFKAYQQVRQMGMEMMQLDLSKAGNKEKWDALKDKRRKLMDVANVIIGCQEQMCILQAPNVFTNPTMRTLVQGQEKQMMLHDKGDPGGARRRIDLLPDGGDWTVFVTRMGLQPGSGGSSIHIQDPYESAFAEGDYAADASRRGTIFDYFHTNLGGGAVKDPIMTSVPDNNIDRYPPGIPMI